MSDGLLPCPFCGGHASLVSPAMGRPYVCCDDNFCTGPKPSADQAIAAWNRRALPATDAREAALREALIAIDALDPESRIGDCSVNAISGLVLRMGEIARAALEGKA